MDLQRGQVPVGLVWSLSPGFVFLHLAKSYFGPRPHRALEKGQALVSVFS